MRACACARCVRTAHVRARARCACARVRRARPHFIRASGLLGSVSARARACALHACECMSARNLNAWMRAATRRGGYPADTSDWAASRRGASTPSFFRRRDRRRSCGSRPGRTSSATRTAHDWRAAGLGRLQCHGTGCRLYRCPAPGPLAPVSLAAGRCQRRLGYQHPERTFNKAIPTVTGPGAARCAAPGPAGPPSPAFPSTRALESRAGWDAGAGKAPGACTCARPPGRVCVCICVCGRWPAAAVLNHDCLGTASRATPRGFPAPPSTKPTRRAGVLSAGRQSRAKRA